MSGLSERDQDVLGLIFDQPQSGGVAGLVALERTAEEKASGLREAEAVGLAEKGLLEEAERVLGEAIAAYGVGSAYNNRAQVRQFLGRREEALRDLERAIMLAEARMPPDVLTLRQAHTQRGMLCKLEGKEDEARREFDRAAQLGSALARKEAAKLNPFAKQCNELMVELMSQYNVFHEENQ